MKIQCPWKSTQLEMPAECFEKKCRYLERAAYGLDSKGNRTFAHGECAYKASSLTK